MKTKQGIYEIITALFVAMVLIMNTVASRVWKLPGDYVVSSAIIMAIFSMVVGDILAEVYTKKQVKKVILLGFIANFIMSSYYTIVNGLPIVPGTETMVNAFQITLGTTFRIFFASLSGYLVSQFANAGVMFFMKERAKNGKGYHIRAFISTVIGQVLDNGLFLFIAFLGILPIEVILGMLLLQTTFEIIVETFMLPISGFIAKKIKELPERELLW